MLKLVDFLMKIQFDTNQYFKKLKNSKSYFQTFINKESLATGVLFLKPDQKIHKNHMNLMRFIIF